MNVEIQKTGSFKLDIFGIIIASFQVEGKEERSRFFEKTFLLADISMDIALIIPFVTLNNN